MLADRWAREPHHAVPLRTSSPVTSEFTCVAAVGKDRTGSRVEGAQQVGDHRGLAGSGRASARQLGAGGQREVRTGHGVVVGAGPNSSWLTLRSCGRLS